MVLLGSALPPASDGCGLLSTKCALPLVCPRGLQHVRVSWGKGVLAVIALSARLLGVGNSFAFLLPHLSAAPIPGVLR